LLYSGRYIFQGVFLRDEQLGEEEYCIQPAGRGPPANGNGHPAPGRGQPAPDLAEALVCVKEKPNIQVTDFNGYLPKKRSKEYKVYAKKEGRCDT
jgi:hypothetical protein